MIEIIDNEELNRKELYWVGKESSKSVVLIGWIDLGLYNSDHDAGNRFFTNILGSHPKVQMRIEMGL